MRADLSDRRALQAPRRDRGSQRAIVHRLPRVHGGVPVRSALHRSEHAHRREVQLLREPCREQPAPLVRERVPDRVPHLRRPRRPVERGRADRAARGLHGPQAGEGHGAEGVLPGGGGQRHPARGVGTPVVFQGRLGPPASAWRAHARSRNAWRAARGLRCAARQAVGHRHGALPALQGHRNRRDAGGGAAVAARVRRAAADPRGTGDFGR